MTTRGSRQAPSPLDRAVDVFRVRQYFNALARGRDLLAGIRRDAGFVDDVRRAVPPRTARRRRPVAAPFPGDGEGRAAADDRWLQDRRPTLIDAIRLG